MGNLESPFHAHPLVLTGINQHALPPPGRCHNNVCILVVIWQYIVGDRLPDAIFAYTVTHMCGSRVRLSQQVLPHTALLAPSAAAVSANSCVIEG